MSSHPRRGPSGWSARTVSLLRATLDSTADGVIVLTQDWRVTAFNGRFQELWNIPAALLEGRDGKALSAHMRPQIENAEQIHLRTQQLLSSPEQEGVDILELPSSAASGATGT
ncbi:MAG TPA: PAS domain-containing protein [Archangium sp.]|nr:PAS domain-containing protein [Archangium sp.]